MPPSRRRRRRRRRHRRCAAREPRRTVALPRHPGRSGGSAGAPRHSASLSPGRCRCAARETRRTRPPRRLRRAAAALYAAAPRESRGGRCPSPRLAVALVPQQVQGERGHASPPPSRSARAAGTEPLRIAVAIAPRESRGGHGHASPLPSRRHRSQGSVAAVATPQESRDGHGHFSSRTATAVAEGWSVATPPEGGGERSRSHRRSVIAADRSGRREARGG